MPSQAIKKPILLYAVVLLFSLCTLCLKVQESHAHPGTNAVHTHTVGITLSGRTATWQPTANETLTLSATIDDPGNALSSATVTFELKNVSNWKGTYMNSKGDSTSPDLEFLSTGLLGIGTQQPKAEDATGTALTTNWNSGKTSGTPWVKAQCPDAKPRTVSIKIRCKDYAAYGELTATLSDGAGKKWAGHTITLSLDTNGNYIADSWENDTTENYNPAVDVETGRRCRFKHPRRGKQQLRRWLRRF